MYIYGIYSYVQYDKCIFEISEILQNILDPNTDPQFRPSLSEINAQSPSDEADDIRVSDDVIADLKKLLCECWAEDWQERPSAARVVRDLGKVNPFK